MRGVRNYGLTKNIEFEELGLEIVVVEEFCGPMKNHQAERNLENTICI